MKRNYELVVIFGPELKTEEKEKLQETIKKDISKFGKIKEEKDWGKKELAYPIKKQKMGFFYWLAFESETKGAAAINNRLKIEERILRFLLINKED